MIEHKEPRIPYSSFLVERYPKNVLLINQGLETVGQVTIKDKFEEELWTEMIEIVNRLQKSRQN